MVVESPIDNSVKVSKKDTYFIKDKNEIRVLGKQQVHIIYKKEHHTFSDGDKIDLSLLS